MPQTHATALFDFSISRQDSLVAGKNFLALFNPSASGKIITVGAFFVSYMAGVASPAFPMRGFRISTLPTGGTEQAESAICRFDTQRFAPAGRIWTNNPTVGTLGAAIFNVVPGIVKDTASMVEQVDAPFGFNPFVLYPGEGVVVRQEAGAVGHLWNLSIIWRELSG